MRKYVITYNEIEGTHYWQDAPPIVEYLKHEHRHVFQIRCEFAVKDSDREIEIFIQQNRIKNFIKDAHGEPALFGKMSCEMIAEEIMQYFPKCKSCEVLEDGYGGAKLIK